MARHGPVFNLGGPFADGDGVDDLTLAVPASGACLGPSGAPTSAQMRGQVLAQRPSGLHEQRQVDRLVGYARLRLVGYFRSDSSDLAAASASPAMRLALPI